MFTFETARSETPDNITFRLTNVIPERIIFVSRGITVVSIWATRVTLCSRGLHGLRSGSRDSHITTLHRPFRAPQKLPKLCFSCVRDSVRTSLVPTVENCNVQCNVVQCSVEWCSEGALNQFKQQKCGLCFILAQNDRALKGGSFWRSSTCGEYKIYLTL